MSVSNILTSQSHLDQILKCLESINDYTVVNAVLHTSVAWYWKSNTISDHTKMLLLSWWEIKNKYCHTGIPLHFKINKENEIST